MSGNYNYTQEIAEQKRIREEEAADRGKQTTKQLHQKAIQQERRDAAAKALEERQYEMIQFILDTPEVENNEFNTQQIVAGLRTWLKKTGREFPDWTRSDLHHVVDELADAHLLELRGKYTRKTPTEREMDKMSRAELEELANGGFLPGSF